MITDMSDDKLKRHGIAFGEGTDAFKQLERIIRGGHITVPKAATDKDTNEKTRNRTL